MLIKRRRGWEIPESQVTPEHIYLNRRQVIAAGGLAAGSVLLPRMAFAQEADPTADLYPAPRNETYMVDREITPEDINGHYNNFYEYGTSKSVAGPADAMLETRPWTVALDGMVEAEQTVDIDTLIRAMPLEERVYRHRCVETWSMTIPFTGFPMSALVNYARPLSGAAYVRMETFYDPGMAPLQRQPFYPWPYVEGLTMAEAMNDLTFLVTGTYGHPMAKVHGAPLRLSTPWKYGFKSVKSIVKFTFTDERPVSFWEELSDGQEYGFWANVNPDVPHPRWSQATETILHTGDRVPTLLYNGYGDYVAAMYEGLEGEMLFR